ncbi:putative multidrug resistance ABC transporter ATP-binding/permease protein YheI [Paenibacillus plantiphilus]|uniref:Multidrug resistance ABC transporter ATP-binding/permease protein YheI n=1 Tax=Paenibacillus plantiphilus TaxID=2905650 RepID=A0ABM9CCR0_9BACL|nr:ABC transporter ATP-binding protein [Paenibacillus plantiphilus]CAH1209337.1 putative multidrug resistance ABC transporter ATP-binding/permease protein YheI [Paenibacillus plantiphilus]
MKPPRLLPDFFRATWYIYLSSVSLHAIASIVYVFFPKVLGEFTDRLQTGLLTGEDIVRYSLLLLAIGVGHAVIGGFGQYLVMYVGRLFEFLTRRKLFAHFTGLSEHFYSQNGVGKLLSYFMNDVTSVRESISMGVNQTAMATMLLLSCMVAMVTSGIPLYLIAASVGPLFLIPWIVTKFGPAIRKRSLKVQESLGTMTESAEEQFGGIRVTKKFAVEPIMIDRFGATVDDIRDNQLSLVRLSSIFQALIPFLGSTSLIIALTFGGYLTVTGHITLGNFVALTLYIRMLMNPLQQIGNVINTIQRSRASLQRLNELLAKEPDIREMEGAREVRMEEASIRINNLTFSYPDAARASLHDISLDIEPGMTLGIVGRTGSGKTTLMKLLLRTYNPPVGTIFIGDTDIHEQSLENLRSGIAYVPQDGFLFSTTIRENIAFSRRDANEQEVETAARQAQVYNNIIAFPNQFETKLGERGVTLSGGQRQRTSLARGLIKDAPVMILDDSVSAVDAVTETEILSTIQAEREGKTTIIIAHRISAIKHADLIVVLDGGRIVQRGTHEELLEQQGLYATLYAIQEEGSQHVAGH